MVRIEEVVDCDECRNVLDTPMEDTVTAQGGQSTMNDDTEDTIIVRGERPLQRVHNQVEARPFKGEQIALTHDDVIQLRNMVDQIEQLREQASFNSTWRKEAETDYFNTRNRLMNSESMSSTAVAAASELGQLSNSLGSQIAWLELNLSHKIHQLGEHEAEIARIGNLIIPLEYTVTSLVKGVSKLNSESPVGEVAVLQQRVSDFEEKLSKEKRRRTKLAEDFEAYNQRQEARISQLEQCFLSAEGTVKEAANSIHILRNEIHQLKAEDRKKEDKLRHLEDELERVVTKSLQKSPAISHNRDNMQQFQQLKIHSQGPPPQTPPRPTVSSMRPQLKRHVKPNP